MNINEKEKDQLKDGIVGKSEESQNNSTPSTSSEGPKDQSTDGSDEHSKEVSSDSEVSSPKVEEQVEETKNSIPVEETDNIQSAEPDEKGETKEEKSKKDTNIDSGDEKKVTTDISSDEQAEIKAESGTSHEKEQTQPDEPSSDPKHASTVEETVAAFEANPDQSDENNEKDKAADQGQEKATNEEDEDNEEDDEDEENQLDYSNYTKKQMVQVLESLLKEDDFSQVGRILKEIKKPYDDLVEKEREEAYERYIEDGGEKDGFEYRLDELSQRFEKAFGKLKERRNQYFNSLEKQKEQNLQLKLDILEKLREIVDSEETGTSINTLKELQKQWKEVGVIPASQAKSLWANYNALLDRFYDQRSIYFELKELDRKKNYDLKIELCEKAEELSKDENIREVIRQLNELHEEFKHIGPVPKEDQDAVWERFKAASDKIYAKRKDYYEKLKSELKVNQVAKEALVEKVQPFAEFSSEKISDWNSKTKEIIAIQKEWESIGSLPKEKAKSINKQFWSSFKSFFNNKGQFFKKLEEERKENLKLKQELAKKADELKDSDDFRQTSDELKRMQKKWKEIGPVPEKHRNEVFHQFKGACDHFFDRRRANSGKIEKEYEENLVKKQELCQELEEMITSEKVDLDRVKTIEAEWSEIGFVPKSNIRSIQKRYTNAISEVTEQIDIPESEKHKIRFSAQFHNINYGPGSERMIQKKEGALRRQITNLENDINLWKNNIDFFASSKNADKLKKDFQVKIDKANAQLKSLKEQLKVISNI